MLQLAYDHQDAGRPVYICTAASQGTADMLAHVLGFDGAAGSGLEARDGVYTGRFDGPFCYREGKPARMRQLAARDGIDLAASYAYSDSASDIPMLRAVGHPVAVNPDAELAAHGARRGLGGPALRAPRPAAEGRHGGGGRPACGGSGGT